MGLNTQRVVQDSPLHSFFAQPTRFSRQELLGQSFPEGGFSVPIASVNLETKSCLGNTSRPFMQINGYLLLSLKGGSFLFPHVTEFNCISQQSFKESILIKFLSIKVDLS